MGYGGLSGLFPLFPLFSVDYPKKAAKHRATSTAPAVLPAPFHGSSLAIPLKGNSRPDGSAVNASGKGCTVNGVRWTPIENYYRCSDRTLKGPPEPCQVRVIRAPIADCFAVLLRGLTGHDQLNGQPLDLVCLVGSACRSRRCHYRPEPVPPALQSRPRPGAHDRTAQQPGAEAYLVRPLRLRFRALAGVKRVHITRAPIVRATINGSSLDMSAAGNSRPKNSLVVACPRG